MQIKKWWWLQFLRSFWLSKWMVKIYFKVNKFLLASYESCVLFLNLCLFWQIGVTYSRLSFVVIISWSWSFDLEDTDLGHFIWKPRTFSLEWLERKFYQYSVNVDVILSAISNQGHVMNFWNMFFFLRKVAKNYFDIPFVVTSRRIQGLLAFFISHVE